PSVPRTVIVPSSLVTSRMEPGSKVAVWSSVLWRTYWSPSWISLIDSTVRTPDAAAWEEGFVLTLMGLSPEAFDRMEIEPTLDLRFTVPSPAPSVPAALLPREMCGWPWPACTLLPTWIGRSLVIEPI